MQAFAQNAPADTVFRTDSFNLSYQRADKYSAGTKISKTDSITIAKYRDFNISDLLGAESHLFIKSAGLGGLATSSVRGGNANHTAVLWNGFNLNNPMYGQFDLALMPAGIVNEVDVQYGGAAALWGSGAVGATVHLNNNEKFNKGNSVLVGAQAGSFGTFSQNLSLVTSKKRYVASLKFYNKNAENDFTFFDEKGAKQKQSHARLAQTGFLCENFFIINSSQKINLRFWYQQIDREIPPVLNQRMGTGQQWDQSYRVTSEWQKTAKIYVWMIRGAWFREFLDYNDVGLISKSNSHIAIGETELRITKFKRHFITAGINNTYTHGIADGYLGGISQHRTALFASYKYLSLSKKTAASVGLRKEFISGYRVPLTWSGGASYQVLKWMKLNAAVSAVYRVPTFNELYWDPGGRRDLLPEQGVAEEGSIVLEGKLLKKKVDASFSGTVFNRNMHNQIIWLPYRYYWSPQNILDVWSRGGETETRLKMQYRKYKIGLNVLTAYTVATNETPAYSGDESQGRQIAYVPMYSGHATLRVQRGNLIVSVAQHYQGYNFISADNYNYLDPFFLTDFYAAYSKEYKKIVAAFFVKINNIFSERYMVVAARPMPGINFTTGLTVKFSKPNKNQ